MKNPPNVRKSLSLWRASSTDKSRTANSKLQPSSSKASPAEDHSLEVPPLSASKTKELRQRLSRMFDGGTDAISTHLSTRDRSDASKDENAVQSCRNRQMDLGDNHIYPSSNASIHSLPLKDLPDRKSSLAAPRKIGVQDFPSWKLAPASAAGQLIPSRGRSNSPVKKSALREAVSSDQVRRSSSRTFLRSRPPIHVLEQRCLSHRRLQIFNNLTTSLFVGGGTVEGHIRIDIDQHESEKIRSTPLLLSKLSVDVLGFEEINDGRKHVFLALASDAFDEKNPPPLTIVQTQDLVKGSELFWTARAGNASIPFVINLPLNVGPAPYSSRQARIRYVVLSTLVFEDGKSRDVVSHSSDVSMLTVFDPQKALASLPSPLIASETIRLPGLPGPQSVKLTCGLHRQIWISGSSVFVDIHIVNQSTRLLRRIDIQIQKVVLWYAHAAAGTMEANADHLRVPQQQNSEVVAVTSIKKSKDWQGILPHNSEVCTRHIQIPRQDVTVSTGRFFEVRYFLNVVLTVALFKTVVVQIPITIIHMNSLDIVPNALAQVAASIEAKRSRTLPVNSDRLLRLPYHQGQAFIAPQKLSLDRSQHRHKSSVSSAIEGLKRDLDRSPRRCRPHHKHYDHQRGQSIGSYLMDADKTPCGLDQENSTYSRRSHESDCYHCHIQRIDCDRVPLTSRKQTSPLLPQLQVSTSGLDFTESEFTVPESPPKKVMLSEHERKMINQQRELQKRRDWVDAKQQTSIKDRNHPKQIHFEKQITVVPSQKDNASTRPAGRGAYQKRASSRKRSKTLDHTLNLATAVGLRQPLSNSRRRANTGPNRLNSTVVSSGMLSNTTRLPSVKGIRTSSDKQRISDTVTDIQANPELESLTEL